MPVQLLVAPQPQPLMTAIGLGGLALLPRKGPMVSNETKAQCNGQLERIRVWCRKSRALRPLTQAVYKIVSFEERPHTQAEYKIASECIELRSVAAQMYVVRSLSRLQSPGAERARSASPDGAVDGAVAH